MRGRLYPVTLTVVVLAATLVASQLFADNLIEIDQKYKEQAVRLFQPGALLVWSCPTCSYKAEVLQVKSVKAVAYSPGKISIQVHKSLVMAARNGIDTIEESACASPDTPEKEKYDTLGEYGIWSVDFSYTYYSPRNDGEFQNVGALFGINNNPATTITFSKAALNKIQNCAQTAVDEE